MATERERERGREGRDDGSEALLAKSLVLDEEVFFERTNSKDHQNGNTIQQANSFVCTKEVLGSFSSRSNRKLKWNSTLRSQQHNVLTVLWMIDPPFFFFLCCGKTLLIKIAFGGRVCCSLISSFRCQGDAEDFQQSKSFSDYFTRAFESDCEVLWSCLPKVLRSGRKWLSGISSVRRDHSPNHKRLISSGKQTSATTSLFGRCATKSFSIQKQSCLSSSIKPSLLKRSNVSVFPSRQQIWVCCVLAPTRKADLMKRTLGAQREWRNNSVSKERHLQT